MEKFIVKGWNNAITSVEVYKETEHTIWFKRDGVSYFERKNTSWQTTHNSKLEALQFIHDKLKKEEIYSIIKAENYLADSRELAEKANEYRVLIEKEKSI